MARIWHGPRRRLVAGTLLGLVVGMVLAITTEPGIAIMAGITAAELAYLGLSLAVLLPLDGDATRASSGREDFRPVTDEILVGVACALAVVVMVALHLGAGGHAMDSLGAGITVLGVFAAWACVVQTYAQHYAHEHFRSEHGIDFSMSETPDYTDFLYFSAAIGMTYVVTDCTVGERRIRRIVLRHALISFLFGTVLLAAAVSLVGGWVTGG